VIAALPDRVARFDHRYTQAGDGLTGVAKKRLAARKYRRISGARRYAQWPQ
jgi:hypothetical protein